MRRLIGSTSKVLLFTNRTEIYFFSTLLRKSNTFWTKNSAGKKVITHGCRKRYFDAISKDYYFILIFRHTLIFSCHINSIWTFLRKNWKIMNDDIFSIFLLQMYFFHPLTFSNKTSFCQRFEIRIHNTFDYSFLLWEIQK